MDPKDSSALSSPRQTITVRIGETTWSIPVKCEVDVDKAQEVVQVLVDDAVSELHKSLRSTLVLDRPTDLKPAEFFDSWYIPRTLVNLASQEPSSLADISSKWQANESGKSATPIALVGESGSGKTIEQLKVAAEGLYPREGPPRFLPVFLTEEQNLGQQGNSIEHVLFKRLTAQIVINADEVRQYLKILPPTLFLLDPNQTNDLDVFLAEVHDFHKRYPHHLVLLTLRMPTAGISPSKSTAHFGIKQLRDTLRAEVNSFGDCDWYCFQSFERHQIVDYLTSSGIPRRTAALLGTQLSRSMPNNALVLYLAREVPTSAAVEFRGGLYEQFIRKWYRERSNSPMAKVAITAAHAIAVRMCDKQFLSLAREDIVQALRDGGGATSDPEVEDALKSLSETGLLIRLSDGTGFKFRHDSFAVLLRRSIGLLCRLGESSFRRSTVRVT